LETGVGGRRRGSAVRQRSGIAPSRSTDDANCLFCHIGDGTVPAHVVADDQAALAFLDHRPLFPGHVLVVPRAHHRTLADLPADQVAPFFATVWAVEQAVRLAMGADGSFVAVNNTVSQSVPHLHVHVVPRRRGDGLRGFFWPRQRYESEDAMAATAQLVRAALGEPGRRPGP